MKNIIVIGLLVTLSGCGWFDRTVTANLTGYSTHCVKGLSVIQLPSGAFYERDVNDKLVSCK